MDKIIELIADALLAGYALGVLVTLCFIAAYGAVQVIEPRPWILWSEIGVSVIAIATAIERYWRDLKRPR
jgi:hypothetical protein